MQGFYDKGCYLQAAINKSTLLWFKWENLEMIIKCCNQVQL